MVRIMLVPLVKWGMSRSDRGILTLNADEFIKNVTCLEILPRYCRKSKCGEPDAIARKSIMQQLFTGRSMLRPYTMVFSISIDDKTHYLACVGVLHATPC